MAPRRMDIRRLWRRDAFTPSSRQGLTTPNIFLVKVRKIVAQENRHQKQMSVKKIHIWPLKARIALGIGIPTNLLEVGITFRELYQARALKKKLLKTPRMAARLAEEFRGTKAGPFFAKAAAKAEEIQGKERGRQTIEKIAERRRGIQAAEQEWLKKGGAQKDFQNTGRAKGIRKPAKASGGSNMAK